MLIVTKTGTIRKSLKIVLSIFFALYFINYMHNNLCTHNSFVSNLPLSNILYFIHYSLLQIIVFLHKTGHLICEMLLCPKLISIINGTLFQIIIPFIFIIIFRVKKKFFLMFISIFIFALSLDYSSWYISTINGSGVNDFYYIFGQEKINDFYFLLSNFNILEYAKMISFILEILSHILLFLAVVGMIISSFLT